MHRAMPRVLLALLVVAMAACGGGGGGGDGGEAAVASRLVDRAPGPATITVDFASPVNGQRALTGLLLGIGQTDPPDAMIQPIKPQLLRAWPDVVPYTRAVQLGAPYVELVSDEWGYPF